MPGLISSLPGTAGLPPFIFSLTSYPELNSAGATLKRCLGSSPVGSEFLYYIKSPNDNRFGPTPSDRRRLPDGTERLETGSRTGNILARAYRMSAINRLRLGTCSLRKME